MRVIHLAKYAGPYPGSFIAMLRAVAGVVERCEAVFDPVAADRAWYSELGAEMPVRLSPAGADRAAIARFIRALLDEEPDEPTVLHTHFTGFDLPAVGAVRG